MLGRSTNAEEFQEFLKLVKRKVVPAHSKPILLYDGASAHLARASQRLLEELF